MLKTAQNGVVSVNSQAVKTTLTAKRLIARIAMTTALTAVALTGTSQLSHANDGAWTNWNTQNNFDVSSDGTTTNINASGNLAGGTSSNLDILGHQTVNVNQSSSDALFYARAEGNQDPTQILGTLNSNGRLLVIDRNGVFFGPGSSVDAAGIVATTGDISDEQIRNNEFGNYTFENVTDGRIDLQGQITVAEAGLAAFVAPTVTNSGVINAKVGKVAFASGEKVTLDLYGDKLVEIEVAGDNADALIENTGTISAEGGQVHMSAAAAKNAVDNIVNVEGVVTVASATKVGGKIVLSGGDSGVVKVAAKLDASGKNGGGKIDVKGQDVQVAESAVLDASATENGDGGRVDVIAENHLDFRGLVLSRGGEEGGNGGDAEVSGYGILGYTGRADLSAKNGAMGTLLLDPEFAVIHSGSLHNPLGAGYVLSAQALANTMQTASIVVQADNFIDVGTRTGGYNTGNVIVDAFLNTLTDGNIDLSTYDYDRFEQVGSTTYGPCPFCVTIPDWDWVNYYGTTAGNISFDTATLNINKDLTLGTGNLDINASTVNLNAKLYDYDTGVLALMNQGDITTVASTVNVLSNNALIQQGIYAAAAGADVNVSAGTYNESVDIYKSITLNGANAGLNPNSDTRVSETIIKGDQGYTLYVNADDVTIDGLTVNGSSLSGGYDDAIWTYDSNNLAIRNNIVKDGGFGIYSWGDSANTGLIEDNKISDLTGHGIYIYGNQYYDVLNNNISDVQVGITTENFYSASLDGTRGLIDGNTISAKSIGIRNNLSYGSQSGFQISNNTITAEDTASDRRWTGIDIISQMGGVGTLFLNNDIDGSAVSATRLAVGYEGTNLTAGNTVIDGGDVSGVEYGVWATDGSFYTGAVNDLTIQNVAFANIGEAAILAEDVYDAEDATKSVNATGTKITIGSGNTYTNTPYELAIAGANITVNDNAVNSTLVKAAGNSTYIGEPSGYVGGQWEVQNGSIQKGINATAAGGTVDVEAGTFTEDLTISKNGLTLNGAQAGVDARDRSATETILEGYIKTASNLNGLTVDGFTIEHQGGTANAYASLYLGNNVSNVSAINNIFEGQDPTGANRSGGIITSSTGVKDIVAENNLFKNYRYGIYVNRNADNFAIHNNNFDANNYGVIIQDGGSATHIDGNNFLNNTLAGVYVWSANGPISSIGTFTNNFFRDNTQHISYRDGNAPDLLVDASTGNQFYSDGSFKTTDTMTLDELFALEDLVTHKLDNSSYGLIVLREGNVYVTQASGSIQRGIDASSVGGTVNVDSSTYQENLLIDKSVKLTGHGTTLQYDTANNGPGRGTAGNLITVTADDVNIDPFTFDGLNIALYGVNANGADNLIIDGNTFQNFKDNAILLDNSDDAVIKGNTVTSIGKDGILVKNSDGVKIVEGNSVTDAGFAGISIQDVTNATVDDNSVTNAGGSGIYARNADGSAITGNTVSGTWLDIARLTGSGIHVLDTDVIEASGNTVDNTGKDGIFASNSTGVEISSNLIGTTGGANNIKGDGIYANASNGIQILNNQIANTQSPATDYGSGIQVINTTLATIKGNTITDSGWDGMRLQNNSNLVVDGNTLTNIARVGIWGGNIATASIINNTVTNDGLGGYGSIHADGGSNWTVSGNDVDGGDYGIRLNGTSGKNVIKSNTVDNVSVDGVYVENITGTSNHTTGVDIESNQIGRNGGNVAGNGVTVINSPNARAFKNTITAGQKGIFANNVTNMHVFENKISGAKVAGLHITNSPGSSHPGNDVDIWRNTITNGAGATGILLENSAYATVGYHSTNPFVTTANGGNTITGGANGIVVRGSNNAYLSHNTISGQVGSDGAASADGIYVIDSNAVHVLSNVITNVDDEGIQGDNADNMIVNLNRVTDAGGAGISLMRGSDNQTITNNTITTTGHSGIFSSGKGSLTITGNTISDVGNDNGGNNFRNDGIHVDNAFAREGNRVSGVAFNEGGLIDNNTISDFGDAGIELVNINSGLTVSNNTISDGGTGVFSNNSDYTVVDTNDISDMSVHGVNALNSNAVEVLNNTISDIGQNGIVVGGTSGTYSDEGATITGNNIQNAGYDGVHVHYANGNVVISENTIDHSGDDGIEAHHINGKLTISDNTISQSGYGYSNGGEGSPYGGLDEFGNGHDGIQVSNVYGNSYNGGEETSARSASVSVYSPYAVTISGNTINISGDDGVEVTGVTGRVLISENEITNSGYGDNSSYGDQSYHGSDAIHVSNVFAQNDTPILYTAGSTSTGYYGYDVDIIGNTIDTAADDGIEVVDAGSVLIDSNIVTNVGFNPDYYGNGGDGIHVRNVYGNSNISAGFIEGEEAGHVDPYAVVIVNNTVGNAAEEPVFNDDEVQYFRTSEIRTSFIGDDGIEVANAGRTLIDGNTIKNAGHNNGSIYSTSEVSFGSGDSWGADGIHVRNVGGNYKGDKLSIFEDGSFGSDENMVTITNNTVDVSADDGIQVLYSGNTLIDGNTVSNAGFGEGYDYEGEGSRDGNGADGIHVDTGFEVREVSPDDDYALAFVSDYPVFMNDTRVQISNNSVDTTGNDGIETNNVSNLIITDNNVSNSQAHGVLVGGEQNGSVLLSGNTLTNNPVGARFESGIVDISSLENPNSIINTNTSALPVGLQFDGNPEKLSIAGLTIGATQFEGFQNEGSYYVRFEDGSILDTLTGLPLLVNGLNASYDGFKPPVNGVLTQAQLDFIEARLFDADDVTVNGRGQIFAGFVPALGLTLDNIEDFFNQFGLNGGDANAVQLIITGLPSLGQLNQPINVPTTGPAVDPFDPSFLAGLEPAAGEETGNEQGAENLNSIEPDAGDEEATCWGDALNYASSGITTTYSFGGSMEDSMAQQASCASGSGA